MSTTSKIIDYWPSWYDWDRSKLAAYKKGGAKERVDIINISFALPQADGSLKWNDIDDGNKERTIKIIKELQAEGKKVIIAVGGATAHNWNLDSPDAIRRLAENTRKFMAEYGLDGVDIDYEGLDRQKREKLADFIVELRKLLPQGEKIISYAAWSIGAYGKDNPGHTHPEWGGGTGGNSGIDINILKRSGHLLDHVNVMSYDAFDPNVKPPFNPIEAIEAYRSLMGGRADKVFLGIELGKHAWPLNVMTKTTDVRPWLKYAADHHFGGAMFWTLGFDVGDSSDPKEKTGEKPGAFLAMIKELMPRKGVTVDTRQKADVKHNLDIPLETKTKNEGSLISDGSSPGSIDSATPSSFLLSQKAPAPKPDEALVEIVNTLNINDLSPEHQKQIIEIYKRNESELKKIDEVHEGIKRARTPNLPKEQVEAHDQQLDGHLKNVKDTFKQQIEVYIAQLREHEKAGKLKRS